MLVDNDTAMVKKAITDAHNPKQASPFGAECQSYFQSLSERERERITLTKATARLFVWEPLDELLVTRQHSRSRWDRVRKHIQSFNHMLFQIYPLWTFIHSLEAFRLIKAKAVGATWAGPDLYSF